ncbi:RagB/SusD family nutrient uptake outer membrane protein [Tamlana fucoidanivorans]|nr:RagB/SusD family nutrient uptake outer membrane protein [Tamlana fucoidanivorans]
MRNILIAFGILIAFSSCDDYFDPKLTNERSEEQFLANADYVRGLLTYAYRAIPSSFDTYGGDFLDAATDNALSNVPAGGINRMVETDGFWSAVSNPINNWQGRYDDLKNVNQFIEIGLDGTVVYFKADEERDEAYRQRLKGEAYFLRAWIHFDLLRRYGGIDTSGNLMGIPLITSFIDINVDDLNLSRNTYDECVQQIVEDLNVAITNLPSEYTGSNDDFGINNLGRPTSIASKALKSRVLLYAASPSFGTSSYTDAAQAANDVIDDIGTTLPNVYDIDNISKDYFNNDTNDELIMRRVNGGTNGDNGLEQSNFPPSLLGNGRCNPSQNLVDAFPMANGYPINNPSSGYDENMMYNNRDPRFEMTVIYNNRIFKGQAIETFQGGNNVPPAPGVTVENSTRTGYYLRKWISNSSNLVPGNISSDYHYNALLRKAEVFLNLAEAANEAYGPDGGNLNLTARQAIAEVRRRAGIASGGNDDYLASITTKEAMRELIKNERRIELCFEGHYFFDLRRWKDNLNMPIEGVTITKNPDDSFNYDRQTIVVPSYKDFMIYGPLPFNEILKTQNITQNQGW